RAVAEGLRVARHVIDRQRGKGRCYAWLQGRLPHDQAHRLRADLRTAHPQRERSRTTGRSRKAAGGERRKLNRARGTTASPESTTAVVARESPPRQPTSSPTRVAGVGSSRASRNKTSVR